MAAPIEHSDRDQFRVQFKRYKRRKPPPDLSEVIEFMESDQVSQFHPRVTCQTCAITLCKKLGLKPLDQWHCFSIQSAPGFVYIKNPFCPGYQRYWSKRCLQDYPNKPNRCNLDCHHARVCDLSLWDDSVTTSSTSQSKKCLIDQLRWVTLGYHYDWASKHYHQHNNTPFPGDLAGLSAFVAAIVGHPTFSSQAGIVNFYHFDSTLGGHTDHSEFDLTVPILSFSLGQSAIFLLGGKTKATSPLAMYLHSGDIIVMGGQSRLCYHSVPRILRPEGSKKLPARLDKADNASALRNSCESTNEQVSDHNKRRPPDAADWLVTSSSFDKICKSDLKISSDANLSNSNTEMISRESEVPACTQSICHESDSPFHTRTEKVETVVPGVESDEYRHDSQCSLKCISERFFTDSDCALMEERTLALQNDQAWEPFAKFMSRSRISISVRQVVGVGCGFPAETMVRGHESSTSTCSEQKEDVDISGTKSKAQCLNPS